ncbi:unnamed protein product [Cylicocyclus nassatus]|uniref:Uncharacterized protein n=1 Tax=Cylicocyclus nassatus TaxID=53992 RepID=A0AA36MD43_CYLNA|nr:unnamed protein product [Cylicocyclus nassatus]
MSKEGEDAYEQLGPNAAPEPAPLPLPPPPPPEPPAPPPEPPVNGVKTKGEEKTQTLSVERFALRPGDDVDLSSERGTTAPTIEEKASKSKEKVEVDKKLEEPLKPPRSEPYKESTMLKFCHIVTLLLLVFSFLLLVVIVIQFIDIFVWVPLLLDE